MTEENTGSLAERNNLPRILEIMDALGPVLTMLARGDFTDAMGETCNSGELLEFAGLLSAANYTAAAEMYTEAARKDYREAWGDEAPF